MHLIEQFRVLGLDGLQHTVACYEDFCDWPDARGRAELVDTFDATASTVRMMSDVLTTKRA